MIDPTAHYAELKADYLCQACDNLKRPTTYIRHCAPQQWLHPAPEWSVLLPLADDHLLGLVLLLYPHHDVDNAPPLPERQLITEIPPGISHGYSGLHARSRSCADC